jgi:hypothetical protein
MDKDQNNGISETSNKANCKRSLKKLEALIGTTIEKQSDQKENLEIKKAINDLFDQLAHKKDLLFEAAEIVFDYFNNQNKKEISKYIACYLVENERKENLKFNELIKTLK